MVAVAWVGYHLHRLYTIDHMNPEGSDFGLKELGSKDLDDLMRSWLPRTMGWPTGALLLLGVAIAVLKLFDRRVAPVDGAAFGLSMFLPSSSSPSPSCWPWCASSGSGAPE